jgi:UDP-GlcNAc:undecaprenyl-phosphate GlcNAc-1-phosphate transferase
MIPPTSPRTAIAAFTLALMIAALLTPNLRRFAEQRGLLDEPRDSRKIHPRGLPRIGGLAIIAAFYGPLIGLLLYETDLGALFYADGWPSIALLGGGLAIAALGLFDDLRGAGARTKLIVEFAIAAGLYYCGYQIREISFPGFAGGGFEFGLLAFPLTMLWIVGVINAMNLIDGLDGLAGAVALCAVSTNLIVAIVRVEPVMMLCMAALAGALIGFLFYNFNPASIFMGDSGSLFLGYVLAVSSIRTHQKSAAVVSLLVPLVALAVPITDTALAMARRALAGRSMFNADREHIHHRLLNLGLTQRQAVLILTLTSLVLGGVALALAFVGDPAVAWVLVVVAVCGTLALRRIGFFHVDKGLIRLRRRNRELRSAVDVIAHQLRRAVSVDQVLESAKSFAGAVSADAIWVELDPARFKIDPPPGIVSASWAGPKLTPYNGKARDLPELLRARFDLPRKIGKLELNWVDRAEMDRDHELAAEAVCRNIGVAIDRLRRPRPQWGWKR